MQFYSPLLSLFLPDGRQRLLVDAGKGGPSALIRPPNLEERDAVKVNYTDSEVQNKRDQLVSSFIVASEADFRLLLWRTPSFFICLSPPQKAS